MLAKTIPAPPVASSTARAVKLAVLPSSSQNLYAHHASILQQQVAGKSELAKMNIGEFAGVIIESAAESLARSSHRRRAARDCASARPRV